MQSLVDLFNRIDIPITRWMARYGIILLRISIGVVFFWFGILKFFPGLSPAETLAIQTIEVLTFGLVKASVARILLPPSKHSLAWGFCGEGTCALPLRCFSSKCLALSRPSSSSLKKCLQQCPMPQPWKVSTSSKTLYWSVPGWCLAPQCAAVQ